MKKPPSQRAERPGSVVVRRRQLAADAIRADPACSDRSIAHDLGVNRGLVARMRRELAVAGEAVLGLPVRGRDGRPTSTRPGTCRGSRNWTGSTADCTPWSGWSNRRSSRGTIGPGRRRSAGYCVGSSSGCGSGSTDWSGSKRGSIPGVDIAPKMKKVVPPGLSDPLASP